MISGYIQLHLLYKKRTWLDQNYAMSWWVGGSVTSLPHVRTYDIKTVVPPLWSSTSVTVDLPWFWSWRPGVMEAAWCAGSLSWRCRSRVAPRSWLPLPSQWRCGVAPSPLASSTASSCCSGCWTSDVCSTKCLYIYMLSKWLRVRRQRVNTQWTLPSEVRQNLGSSVVVAISAMIAKDAPMVYLSADCP